MIADLTITSLETITCFNLTTGAFKFALDELQNASIANSQETVDITGKSGRKLSTLKRNKTVTVSGTNGMVSGGLLASQVGGEWANKATEVMWTDYLTIASNTATTSYKAIGTAGAEILELYTRNADGTLGTELEQDATAAAGKFAYDPSTKALTFSGLADGTDVVVFYKRRITADTLSNVGDKFSEKVTMYIDALAEDKCANVYHVQFYFPKADISGEFSIDLGDNQTVHAFEAESLSGACGAHGELWTYTVFGANTADAN